MQSRKSGSNQQRNKKFKSEQQYQMSRFSEGHKVQATGTQKSHSQTRGESNLLPSIQPTKKRNTSIVEQIELSSNHQFNIFTDAKV